MARDLFGILDLGVKIPTIPKLLKLKYLKKFSKFSKTVFSLHWHNNWLSKPCKTLSLAQLVCQKKGQDLWDLAEVSAHVCCRGYDIAQFVNSKLIIDHFAVI